MTFPASGTLTLNDFNTKAGRASGTSIDMSWIYNNTKSGQQSYSISNYYSKNWYQRNVDNCNNGNCNCGNCNCFDFPQNCRNCYGSQCTVSNNCDTRSWFQNNCNCSVNCYNCNYNVWQSNCNCNCDCVCACQSDCCFPAYSMVLMANGEYKRIDSIRIGDKVNGGFGYVNTVLAYHEIPLGRQPLYIINGRHRTTKEHKHFTTEGWAAIDLTAAKTEFTHEITIDNDGTKEKRKNIKFTHTKVLNLVEGMTLVTQSGHELIESIVPIYDEDPNQLVYTLVCDGTHAHVINGVIASAWARDNDFDYTTWTPK